MFKKRHPEVGARPGTLVLSPGARPVKMKVTLLKGDRLTSRAYTAVDEIPRVDGPEELMWLDVRGTGDGSILMELAQRFGISPLAMEDLVNAPQRPKVESFEQHQLIIAHSILVDGGGGTVIRQIGMVLGKNFVLTFHQDCDKVLEPIRTRMKNPEARLRRNGPDYLVYAILDVCVDRYYPVLEQLGETIEMLEQHALRSPRPELLAMIHSTKNQLLQVRRSIWPQRDMTLALLDDDGSLLTSNTREFLRDTHDHCSQLADVVDMYRESTSSLVNTYMSAAAHRSNEIMKVLTLLTSVFVPPTFLAGVYGMNFSRMPELEISIAYPIVLMTMGLMIFGTVSFFYHRGWLSRAPIVVPQTSTESSRKHRSITLNADPTPSKRKAA